jgi:uncharacterized protein YodC (DUF2158 family)
MPYRFEDGDTVTVKGTSKTCTVASTGAFGNSYQCLDNSNKLSSYQEDQLVLTKRASRYGGARRSRRSKKLRRTRRRYIF